MENDNFHSDLIESGVQEISALLGLSDSTASRYLVYTTMLDTLPPDFPREDRKIFDLILRDKIAECEHEIAQEFAAVIASN